MKKTCSSLLALLALSAAANAATLKVGDPAPPLVGTFIQGEPVTTYDKDKVYVVEFWATWCGPCKAAIPHLNELHNKLKDKGVVIIGQNVWETNDALPEPFVKSMGDKMSYRIALDDKAAGRRGTMAQSWLAAAGKSGIPSTFLIDKAGKILWIGHPSALTEDMLTQAIAATLDLKAVAAAEAKTEDQRAKVRELARQTTAAIDAKEWDKAGGLIADLEAVLPDAQKVTAGGFKLDILLAKGDFEAAGALAATLSEQSGSNISFRHQLTSKIARFPGIGRPALEVAEKIAQATNESLGGQDVASLISLGRIAFQLGKPEQAIEYQTRVVELSKEAAKPRMQSFLDAYKAGKMPEERRPTTRPAAAAAKT